LTIRNSELTLTNCLHDNWPATVPCNTACVVVGQKLPCAEYSVVKDQLGGIAPKPPRSVRSQGQKPRSASLARSPLTVVSDLLTSGTFRRAACAALTIGADVGAGEAREPHHSTETFPTFARRAPARPHKRAVVSKICSPRWAG
jgi:hypothetical protein